MYSFDYYGWYTSQHNSARQTDVVPPTAEGTLRPNWTGIEWVLTPYSEPVTIEFIAPSTPIVSWSKKDFLLKFTPLEYSSIKSATITNHELDYYWTLFNVAGDILKTDPITIAGITALETAGLIAPGRALEILA